MISPRLAMWGDRLCLALLCLTLLVEFTGGIRVGEGWSRFSMTSAWRLAMYTLGFVILRHAIVPHPSLRERLIARRQARASSGWPGQRLWLPTRRDWVWAAALIGLATAWTLREQIWMLNGVPDMGDPLFSMWRLSTLAYQLVHDPWHLFSGNIFYPAADTLLYSDAILLPALMAAPLLWAGAPVAIIYGLMCVFSFFASGLTMFTLVRTLTRQFLPALLAAICFAFYPYRFSGYSHLEKLGVFFMPIALLLLWRVLQVGRRSEGIALGLTVAAQTLWSLYLGAFLAVGLAGVTIVRWAAGHFTWRERGKSLLLAALVVVAIVGPYSVPYWQVRAVVGERARFEAQVFSAEKSDLLTIDSKVRLYRGVLSGGANGERHLFPGATAMVLAGVALVPPFTPLAGAAGAGALLAVDGALGLNGTTFSWLYDGFPPFRAFRAPGRFSAVVGLFICLLAGLGLSRFLGRQPGRARQVVACSVIAFAFFELQPTLTLEPVALGPPEIYAALPDAPDAVLVDLPVPSSFNPFDFVYIYYGTFHHRRLVNGASGFTPRDYDEVVDASNAFPSQEAVDTLRRRGAQYVVLHGDFIAREDWARILADLGARSGVTLLAVRPSPRGAEDRLYRLQ